MYIRNNKAYTKYNYIIIYYVVESQKITNNQPPTECITCGVTLTVRHIVLTECTSNEEEKGKHKIPTNLYEPFEPGG